jgi:hypothetical protein
MEVVDKKGVVIHTGWADCTWDFFLKEVLPPFKEIRVGVEGGKQPFAHVFFKAAKKEVIEIVRMNQMMVTFSIMFNSKVQEDLKDVLYIKKLKQTIC